MGNAKTINDSEVSGSVPVVVLTDVQRISRQLSKFFGKVQAAENRNDTSYRSMLKHFRLLDLTGNDPEYYFDAMQVLYCDVPAEEDRLFYSTSDKQAFLATLKLYAIAYCTQNRTPHVEKSYENKNAYSNSFATVCGKFARSTQSQKWCGDRMVAFLDSKNLVSNFRYLDNIVSRMGRNGYKFDYVRIFRDLSMMLSNNRELEGKVRRQWAEQYARSVNRIETVPSTITDGDNEGE